MGTEKEKFSYVVLKKGARRDADPQWPRVVRPVLSRSRHTICRLCTQEGQLSEIITTRSKHSKTINACARRTVWGDLLPVELLTSEAQECQNQDEEEDQNVK